jgi:hypothetical protein
MRNGPEDGHQARCIQYSSVCRAGSLTDSGQKPPSQHACSKTLCWRRRCRFAQRAPVASIQASEAAFEVDLCKSSGARMEALGWMQKNGEMAGWGGE